MPIIKKPDYTIFASEAKNGELTAFPNLLRGWGVTIDQTAGKPPMEWFNALQKRTDEWLTYLSQQGISEWDNTLDYPKTAVVQFGGKFYVSIKKNREQKPDNSQNYWQEMVTFLGISKSIEDLRKEVEKKLTKDQNGADIPDPDLFINNLGLGTAAKSSVVQTTGQSYKDVISQKAATDNFALKALLDNFGGATLLFNKSRDYSLQLSDAGDLSLYSKALDKVVLAFSPSGKLMMGTVGFEHVTDLKSAAKKDVGNGAGQIPDMSFFPLSGMGTDNLITKLPNGLIIQVFRRTVSNSPTVGVPMVTSSNYPTPFPVAVWGVFCTKLTYAQVSVSCESATSTGFDIATVLNTGTGGSTLSIANFIALGY